MTGTVLGAIKIAIPLGGIVTPLLIAAITSRASFGAASCLSSRSGCSWAC